MRLTLLRSVCLTRRVDLGRATRLSPRGGSHCTGVCTFLLSPSTLVRVRRAAGIERDDVTEQESAEGDEDAERLTSSSSRDRGGTMDAM